MDRDAALDAVVRALRRVDFQRDLFGQRIAIRLGLSESDVRALGLLIDAGAATAGRLAEAMGLTTGAVTRLIDRLEQAGYVRRVPDPSDRRRVIVEVIPERLVALQGLLTPADSATEAELERYTPEQLDLIGDFLTRMATLTEAQAATLQEAETGSSAATGLGDELAAPLGGLTAARLAFRSGASHLRIRSGLDLAELYRLRYDGPTPQVRVRDGIVSVQYRGRPFDWRSRSSDIVLNATVPWTIDLVGGVGRLDADLTRIDLTKLSLTGGSERIAVTLGRPRGDVPIRVVGGARTIRFERPNDAAARLHVTGGAKIVEFDDRSIVKGTAETTFADPGFGDAPDRFSIEVVGGVERVIVRRAER